MSVAYLIALSRANDAFNQVHILLPVLQTALLFRRARQTTIFSGLFAAMRANQGAVGALVVHGVLDLVRPGGANLVEDMFGAWRAVDA